MLKSQEELWINTELIHKKIIVRLKQINKPQRFLPEKLKINRSTLFRMSKRKEITIDTFLKITNWLHEDPNKFIFRGTKSLYEIFKAEESH